MRKTLRLTALMLSTTLALAADESAVDRLDEALSDLSARARAYERDRADYDSACGGGTRVRTNRDDLQGWIDNASTPECQLRARRIEREALAIPEDYATAREAARRGGVQPGAVRDATRRYKLDSYTSPAPEPKFRGGALPR